MAKKKANKESVTAKKELQAGDEVKIEVAPIEATEPLDVTVPVLEQMKTVEDLLQEFILKPEVQEALKRDVQKSFTLDNRRSEEGLKELFTVSISIADEKQRLIFDSQGR